VLIEGGSVDPDAQCRLQAAVDAVDHQMSTWKPDSDLMRLNAAPRDTWVQLPDHLMTVLAAGLEISRQTGGAFEMNIGDAVRAWGFGPDGIDLGAIRAASGAQRVPATEALELDPANRRARKSAALALDLSGIAKGYGVDRLAEIAQELGYNATLCSIDGEVRATGRRRNGRPWSVAVETPDDAKAREHSILMIEDMSVATSGDYRHFLTLRETRLSHTMDPRRGVPLLASPASVSVLSTSCMLADAMATALMVMGETDGLHFAKAQSISALFLRRSPGGIIADGTGVLATPDEGERAHEAKLSRR
jgi:thiamine biosynthesis lipoprotein